MATIATPNTAEVEVRWTKGGQQIENTFYYLKGSAWDQASLDELTDTIDTYVYTNWRDQLPTDTFLREVYARDLTAGSGLQSTNTDHAGASGTASGAPLPNNATIAVARKSGLTGRSNNGRIFWPGLSQDQLNTANTMAVATAAAIAAHLLGLDAAVEALDLIPVIVSLYNNHVARPSGHTTPIANWTLSDLNLDSRRRRLVGRGE